MSRVSIARRWAAAASIIATAVSTTTLLSSTDVDGSKDDGGTVVVESTGVGERIMLPPDGVLGQTASSTTVIDISTSVDAPSVDVSLAVETSTTVVDVTAPGWYVSIMTIDRIEVTDNSPGVDVSALGYDELVGVQFEQTVNGPGQVASTELVDPEQLSAESQVRASRLMGALQTVAIAFPAEPVGDGANWSVEVDVRTADVTIPVTYSFALTDITDDRYALQISYDGDFETTTIYGNEATGIVTGVGTIDGSVDDPLDVSATVDQTLDASFSRGGENSLVSIELDLDMTTTSDG